MDNAFFKQYTLFKKRISISPIDMNIYNKKTPIPQPTGVHPEMRIFVQDQGMREN